MPEFRTTLGNIVTMLNPRVPTRALYFVASLLWGYASWKLLRIGHGTIASQPVRHNLYYIAGFILYFPFYYFIFFKINRKHTTRIMLKKNNLSCVFGFFDFKSYLIMALMISMGISAKKIPGVPQVPVAVLYISLGLSLGSSCLYFLFAGIFNQWMRKKLLNSKIH